MNFPKVLVLASQRGSVGKTWLTAHLGVSAEMGGIEPVADIDVVPRGSLSEWWNRRKAAIPLFAKGAQRRPRNASVLHPSGREIRGR